MTQALLLALCIFFALPTITRAEDPPAETSQSTQMSVQECAAAYIKTTDTLNSCLASVDANAKQEVSRITELMNGICDCLIMGMCTSELTADQVSFASIVYCSKMIDYGVVGRDEFLANQIKSTTDTLFRECLDTAKNSFAANKSTCQSVSPDLFSSYCSSDRTISTACHNNCSPETCKLCEPADAEVGFWCNSSASHQVPARPGLVPCTDKLKVGLECVKNKGCANKSGADRDSCIAGCEADRKVQWDACWLARGTDPPALSALKDEPGLRSIEKTTKKNLRAKKTRVRTGTAGVSSKPAKNNLDKFGLGPSFVGQDATLPSGKRASRKTGSSKGTPLSPGVMDTTSGQVPFNQKYQYNPHTTIIEPK